MKRLSPAAAQTLIGLFRAGRYAQLERLAREAVAACPDDFLAHQLLGAGLLSMGRDEEALGPLTCALRLRPEDASIRDNLGLACLRLGRLDQARQHLESAVTLDPGSISAWVNLSAAARRQRDPVRAADAARRALQLQPGNAAAHLNLGNALLDAAQFEEADRHLREAWQLAPGWNEAALSLATRLEVSGRPGEAEAVLVHGVSENPNDWRLHTNLGRVLAALGRTSDAVSSYERALALNESAFDAFSGLLFLRQHDERIDPPALFALHRRYGRQVEPPLERLHRPFRNLRDPARRLRVGFVSADLRRHALAHFIEPYFEGFDRSSVEVFVYANQVQHDEVSERLRTQVEGWRRVIDMGDDELAQRIRDDGIDVLFDLSGHTAGNRLPVFARRPAPIQMSWLGYPGTTGLQTMDYRLVYAGAVPRGLLDEQFSERLIYLREPTAFRLPDAVGNDPGPLPALANGYVTFASLNRTSKIGACAIALWARILERVPGSRMLIGAVSDDSAATMLRERFAAHGIAADRLELRPYLSSDDYLALHREIDLILDSFPYSGGTTTQNAVRFGVPAVSLAGRTLPQRSGAGILHAAGLVDWIANDESEYVELAVRKARELDALARTRAELPQRVLSRDQVAAVRNLEAGIREAWRRWCEGLPCEAFEVPAPRSGGGRRVT